MKDGIVKEILLKGGTSEISYEGYLRVGLPGGEGMAGIP